MGPEFAGNAFALAIVFLGRGSKNANSSCISCQHLPRWPKYG
jgi:hypothetical protein